MLIIVCLGVTVCSLLGYERYNAMRADPDLCFLERVGMPDVTALSAEQGGGEGVPDIADRYTQIYTYCTHTQNMLLMRKDFFAIT